VEKMVGKGEILLIRLYELERLIPPVVPDRVSIRHFISQGFWGECSRFLRDSPSCA
jgi:hypothetical protein